MNFNESRGKLIDKIGNLSLEMSDLYTGVEIAVEDFCENCGVESIQDICNKFINKIKSHKTSFEHMKNGFYDAIINSDPYPFKDKAIFEYIKYPYPHNVGCIYAEPIYIGNMVMISIGVSILHKKDTFSKKIGFQLARDRSREYDKSYSIKLTSTSNLTKYFLNNVIDKFISRCKKYYVDTHILYPTNIKIISCD